MEKKQEMKRGKAILDVRANERNDLLERTQRTLFERFLRERGGAEWFAIGKSLGEDVEQRHEDELEEREKPKGPEGKVVVSTIENETANATSAQSSGDNAATEAHTPQRVLRTASGAEIHVDKDSGARYKVNSETGESAWIEEDAVAHADEHEVDLVEEEGENKDKEEEEDLPEGWEAFYDEEDNLYFYEKSTERTSWTRPTG